MPSGTELESRVAELQEANVSKKEIAETMLEEDFDTPVSELANLLEMTGNEIGRVKSAVKRKSKSQQTQEGSGKEGDEWYNELPPLAQTFHDAITREMPRNANRAKAITSIFAKNIQSFQTKSQFRAWLSRYGLAPDALSRIEDEIFGFGGDDQYGGLGGWQPGGMPGQGQGQPQIAYAPNPSGGYTPIIVMSQPAPQPQPQPQPQGGGQPNIFTLPYSTPQGGGQQASPEIDALREENKSIRDDIKALNQSIQSLANKVSQPPPQPQPQPQQQNVRRVPMLDDEGNIMRDASGTIVYQEVPYDQNQSMMDMMRGAASMFKPTEPKGLSADEIRNIIHDEVGKKSAEDERLTNMEKRIFDELDKRFPQKEKEGITAEDIRNVVKDELDQRQPKEEPAGVKELRGKVDKLLSDKELDEKTTQAVNDAIDKVYKEAVGPLRQELDDLKEKYSRVTATGESAQFQHDETMEGMRQGLVKNIFNMVDGKLSYAAIWAVASAMKQVGFSDEAIMETIRNMASGGGVPVPGATQGGGGKLADKARDFEAKYLKR